MSLRRRLFDNRYLTVTPELRFELSDRPRAMSHVRSDELNDLVQYDADFGEPIGDGNERMGLVAAVMFLELNGRLLTASEVDAAVRTLALAAGEMSEAEFAAWLEGNSRVT